MKLNAKKIIILMIGVVLIATLEKYLIMTGVLLLIYIAFKRGRPSERIDSDKYQQLDVIDSNELDQFRATYEVTKAKQDEKIQVMRDMDVRQFKGRQDVTVDEVVEYMINHSQYIGLEKREYQMQRITQVCNLTEDDMKEVFHQIWGKCKISEDKEGQRLSDYRREQIRKEDREYEQWSKKVAIKDDLLGKVQYSEEYKKQFYYEDWLREKGYTK